MDTFQNGIALGLLVALALLAVMVCGIGLAVFAAARRITRLSVDKHAGDVIFAGTVRTREWAWGDRQTDRDQIKRLLKSSEEEPPNVPDEQLLKELNG